MVKRLFAVVSLLLAFVVTASEAPAAGPQDTLYMDLKSGRVVIELLTEVAPKHSARIKELARMGFYDGIVFHRVIDGFMAQTGDPKGDGTGGSGVKLKAEFSKVPHLRGVLSMARTSDPDSADSQFFILFAEAPHLNGQFTAWGRVVKGIENVDKIKKGDPARNGLVTDPDRILRLRVAADVKD